MQIVIPTLGRVGRIQTLNYIPVRWHDKTTIVCPPEEVFAHRKDWPLVKVLPEPKKVIGKGIGPKRQYIVNHFSKVVDKILMLDDDMHFYVRKDPSAWNLRYCEQRDMSKLLAHIKYKLGQHTLVGLSVRQGNNHFYPAEAVKAVRQFGVHGINLKKFNGLGLQFDYPGVEVMEDFCMLLHLLTSGEPNYVITNFAWGQSVANQDGGCSTYRTLKIQNQSANNLASMFPKFVKVVEKKTKWEGMETRLDVTVQWKKALLSSGYKGDLKC